VITRPSYPSCIVYRHCKVCGQNLKLVGTEHKCDTPEIGQVEIKAKNDHPAYQLAKRTKSRKIKRVASCG
jgi:hypothetical protein